MSYWKYLFDNSPLFMFGVIAGGSLSILITEETIIVMLMCIIGGFGLSYWSYKVHKEDDRKSKDQI